MKKIILSGFIFSLMILLASCGGAGKSAEKKTSEKSAFIGAKGEVRIITLDPGHFHASLVQKNMYDQISPEAYEISQRK
jgi:hypothetical protein